MKDDIENDPNAQSVKELLDIGSGKKPAAVANIGGDKELTNEQRSRIPYVMGIYHNCFLCNAEPPPAGMYTWKMGGETIITPICVTCSSIVGHKEVILDALRRRMLK